MGQRVTVESAAKLTGLRLDDNPDLVPGRPCACLFGSVSSQSARNNSALVPMLFVPYLVPPAGTERMGRRSGSTLRLSAVYQIKRE